MNIITLLQETAKFIEKKSQTKETVRLLEHTYSHTRKLIALNTPNKCQCNALNKYLNNTHCKHDKEG